MNCTKVFIWLSSCLSLFFFFLIYSLLRQLSNCLRWSLYLTERREHHSRHEANSLCLVHDVLHTDSSMGFTWARTHAGWAWCLNQCKLITVSAGSACMCRHGRNPQCRLSAVFGSPEEYLVWVEEGARSLAAMAYLRKQQAQTKLLISFLPRWGVTGESLKVKIKNK